MITLCFKPEHSRVCMLHKQPNCKNQHPQCAETGHFEVQNGKKISGEGTQPPPQVPPPVGRGIPPPHTPHPSRPPATRPHPPTNDFWIRHCSANTARPLIRLVYHAMCMFTPPAVARYSSQPAWRAGSGRVGLGAWFRADVVYPSNDGHPPRH